MGNSNSGNLGVTQPPPPWTQSLPRDVHRQKKFVALQQGPKVLPERIPGQRLKTTENGRKLQVQGTITPRKVSENLQASHNYNSQFVNHHSSMTALNHAPKNQHGSFFPQSAGSITDLRFNEPPSKSFTSEPDLRESSSPSSSKGYNNGHQHTVISESPTKGKIKSKKRHKAPMPPMPLQASISLPLERNQNVPSPMFVDNWSNASSPAPYNQPSKPKKMGLFKKRSESRTSKYKQEDLPPNKYYQEEYKISNEVRRSSHERSITPTPLRMSSKKELKERARSLDNLQHEIRKTTQSREMTSSMHSLKIIGSIPPESEDDWHNFENPNVRQSDSSDSRRYSTIERDSRSKSKDKTKQRSSSTLDRESKHHKRLSVVERRTYERQLEEQRINKNNYMPSDNKKKTSSHNFTIIPDYKRSSSSCSSYREYLQNEPKDEWDKAEEEWLEKKKKSDNLQSEIINAAKNLRKTSKSPDQTHIIKVVNPSPVKHKEKKIEERIPTTQEDSPKTFFFGMNPDTSDQNISSSKTNSAFSKLNDEDDIKIVGHTVEYSRHSLRPKEKRISPEKENWNRSLDHRERKRNQEKSGKENIQENNDDERTLERKMDKFVATIERTKSKRIPSPEELSNSISCKGDGGYHSRQNSGSFHLETEEGSDEDTVIKMNLRPILPRRQLELPRFSPNAAWKSLSIESAVRSKEQANEINSRVEIYNIDEEKVLPSNRSTDPPRSAGEKSADSGISGDAGSPGPMQEFEPLTADKLRSSGGPLAVSSPVTSCRIEVKRAWTPAEDLDDNSFEDKSDSNKKDSTQRKIQTVPKLTSRTNMFNKSYIDDELIPVDEVDYKKNKSNNENSKFSQPRYFDENVLTHEVNNLTSLNSHVQARSVSVPREEVKENDEERYIQEDNWRDNWSMSRSIPNSLNTCDEPEIICNTNNPARSRSESRMSNNKNNEKVQSRPITPSYLQSSNNGHIMYLPEYKSYQLDKNESDEFKNRSKTFKVNEEVGEENLIDPMFNMQRGKKGKKFTYQSTVRILEKKKIEEQLSKDADEKEKRRLREVEAMLKVEQEFQKKREREKKKLKKQLKLYQKEQQNSKNTIEHTSSSSSSEEKAPSPKTFNRPYMEQSRPPYINGVIHSSQPINYQRPHPYQMNGHLGSSYQSLPVEINDHSHIYEHSENHSMQTGIISGLKKWMKHKKETRSGYNSDASSATVTSVSRKDPDGAPAINGGIKNLDIRAEIIAASRHRNGVVYLERGSPSSDKHSRSSPATSVTSKSSQKRPFTPDSKRTVSPDSRKSLSSEPCLMTQELPEMRQEQVQYKEYRRSTKKFLLPSFRSGPKASPATHNYRREFAVGNISSKGMYHNDEMDRYSRHSNDSRKSKQSHESSKRCSSAADIADSRDRAARSHRQYSSTKPPMPIPISDMSSHMDMYPQGHRVFNRVPKGYASHHRIDSSPARFAQSIITPFNPSKGYRPVSFSPPPQKILSVT